MLLKHFTQNIDCLDREAGVPADMIVEAHGSFATQRCVECRREYPHDLMQRMVAQKNVPHCENKQCNGLVKPDIVFFGEALPEAFHRNRSLPADADLAIVMGTSLTVQPFASLPGFVKEETPRVLINLERVGGLGGRADDVLILGDCDAGVRKLADALGWREELEAMWRKTIPDVKEEKEQQLPPKTRDEKLEAEVEKLTQDIDKSLKLSEEHTTWLKDHLSEKHNLHGDADNSATAAAPVLPEGAEHQNEVARSTWKEPQKETTNGATDSSEQNGNGGIKHVYPHIDEVPPEKPEKSSL